TKSQKKQQQLQKQSETNFPESSSSSTTFKEEILEIVNSNTDVAQQQLKQLSQYGQTNKQQSKVARHPQEYLSISTSSSSPTICIAKKDLIFQNKSSAQQQIANDTVAPMNNRPKVDKHVIMQKGMIN